MRHVSEKRGFTLIELVIVLGTTGLIFAGLWSLLSSGSSQLQAQSAAQQYRQVIDATRKFIANPPSTSTVATNPDGYASATEIDIYDDLVCGAVSPCPAQGVFLSRNFATLDGSNNYTDAFGNQMFVVIRNLDITTDDRWQFMAYSAATNPVSDKLGAQVASLIGSEGGFIYRQPTEGCSTSGTASRTVCGAYGSYAFDVQTNGFIASPSSGRIATLSFSNDSALLDSPWLARQNIGNIAFNTMSTPLYFANGAAITADTSGSNNMHMRGNGISMGEELASTGGGGVLVMNGGTFSMGANGASSAGGILNMAAGVMQNVAQVNGGAGDFNFTSFTLDASQSIGIDSEQNVTITSDTGTVIQSDAGAGITPNDTIVLTVYGGARFFNSESLKFMYNSDATLKKNIADLENPLAKLMQIKGHAFQWKNNDEKSIGLIAQEVQPVYPEIVAKGSDGTLTVDYGKLVAPIIEAIKALKKENDVLKEEVARLKETLTAPAKPAASR